MKHIAVILAGGTGSRIGGNVPKQLLPLEDGRTVLEHAVDTFEQAFCIDEIAIVMHPEWLNEAERLCETNRWQKVKKIIPGGKERWESSYNAVMEYYPVLQEAGKEGGCFMWFHDAARPFVSQRIIAEMALALEEYPAATVAVPVTDTVYRVKEGAVVDVPPRNEFMRAQTPQAVYMPYMYMSCLQAKHDSEEGVLPATDDIGLLIRKLPDTPICIVQGEETNRKITYKGDI